MWYDDYYDDDGDHWDDDHNYDKFSEWYNGCKKRKGQKASIRGRALTHWLVSIKVAGLVHVRRWKERQENFGYKKYILFVPDDQI